ncbi:Nucleotide-binding universal stress protein, UspA family [Halogranum rubrum]|uniref:Nucleotide-binding universal stress protein, UspA family n=1 Tax=Halogranum rubrum TaxID=553466 RepID=A0A1I4HRY9_9EURY|nr:universal stress protein [Halogranum rubrum]SFL44563.1 Nucleotide-binding universal stress protein, UspA family [Halogranum rubrum]
MQRALVVVDDTDAHRKLLQEAAEFTKNTDSELVLFSWLTPERVEENFDALESIERMEGTTYSEPDALDAARTFAREFANETLGHAEGTVEYEIATRIVDDDDVGTAILDTADEKGCDHVFIAGRKRSPTGKVLFGDTTQQVILNFDGPVTTMMN